MDATIKSTTDHEVIKDWIEKRGGHPFGFTGSKALRINIPGRYPGRHTYDGSERLTWDKFFNRFEAKELAFLYQEEMRTGEESYFFRFVSRHKLLGG